MFASLRRRGLVARDRALHYLEGNRAQIGALRALLPIMLPTMRLQKSMSFVPPPVRQRTVARLFLMLDRAENLRE